MEGIKSWLCQIWKHKDTQMETQRDGNTHTHSKMETQRDWDEKIFLCPELYKGIINYNYGQLGQPHYPQTTTTTTTKKCN